MHVRMNNSFILDNDLTVWCCSNVDRSIIPQEPSPGPPMAVIFVGSAMFIIAFAVVAAIFFRRQLRKKLEFIVPYSKVAEDQQVEMAPVDLAKTQS
jgi:hypothetical protein